MLSGRSFDASKHPRGYHGRFGFGAGKYPVAHAMRGRPTPPPHEIKRLHAVVPVRGAMMKAGTRGPGLGGGLGAANSGLGRMIGD